MVLWCVSAALRECGGKRDIKPCLRRAFFVSPTHLKYYSSQNVENNFDGVTKISAFDMHVPCLLLLPSPPISVPLSLSRTKRHVKQAMSFSSSAFPWRSVKDKQRTANTNQDKLSECPIALSSRCCPNVLDYVVCSRSAKK
jgi:hypothetical protein